MELTERQIERLKTRHIMICTPSARGFSHGYMSSYIRTLIECQKYSVNCTTEFVLGSSDLAHARNFLAAKFLKSEATDLIWIDDDMGWDAPDVIKLVAYEHDMIGASCKKRRHGDSLNTITAVPFKEGYRNVDEYGNHEVCAVGLGFTKMTREMLTQILEARPDLKRPDYYDPKKYDDMEDFYGFFQFDGFGGGEDFRLCDIWSTIGGKIWIDPKMKILHYGTGVFFDDMTRYFK